LNLDENSVVKKLVQQNMRLSFFSMVQFWGLKIFKIITKNNFSLFSKKTNNNDDNNDNNKNNNNNNDNNKNDDNINNNINNINSNNINNNNNNNKSDDNNENKFELQCVDEKRELNWLHNTHNHLRMSRILHALDIFELYLEFELLKNYLLLCKQKHKKIFDSNCRSSFRYWNEIFELHEKKKYK
jgi:hypothetical protein